MPFGEIRNIPAIRRPFPQVKAAAQGPEAAHKRTKRALQQFQSIPKIGILARKGHKIIRQNIFWAFFYNTIGIGLAAYGVLSPLFATGAMIASSLMVLLNAQRLKK